MQGAILNFRSTLVDPNNLVAVGCSAGSTPTIVVGSTQVCAGDLVTFSTPTSATTYQWDFPGGIPASAAGAGPHVVTYNTAGVYDVALSVSDATGSNSLTEPDLIYVTDCQPIASTQGCWYFGDQAGLDFSSGAPLAVLDGQIDTTEGCATQCDANSDLLFYTNGVNVWDKNHQIMPSGSGLMGHESAYQGVVILPLPGRPVS